MYRRSFEKREKPEFEQKIIDIRRVARVVAGGRRFNFRVTVVVGNRKGDVGVGLGKAADTSSAIEKAGRAAKKQKIKIPLTKTNSIPYEVAAKFATARIIMRPAKAGRGLVAGSSMRTVLELAGVNDITAKILSKSKNKLNIARAAIKALSSLDTKFVAISSRKEKKALVKIPAIEEKNAGKKEISEKKGDKTAKKDKKAESAVKDADKIKNKNDAN